MPAAPTLVAAVGADAVQVEVHPAQSGDVRDQLDGAQRVEAEVPLLIAVQVGVALDVIVRGQQKAAGAAGRVDHHLARARPNAIDDCLNDRARREVLPGAALYVLGVLLEQSFVGVALHVGRHGRPVFLADQLDDEPAQLRRILDAVLRPFEDQPSMPPRLPSVRSVSR